jgi:hypothetical protein
MERYLQPSIRLHDIVVNYIINTLTFMITVHNRMANVLLMARSLRRRCITGRDNSQKTSILRVSTHW